MNSHRTYLSFLSSVTELISVIFVILPFPDVGTRLPLSCLSVASLFLSHSSPYGYPFTWLGFGHFKSACCPSCQPVTVWSPSFTWSGSDSQHKAALTDRVTLCSPHLLWLCPELPFVWPHPSPCLGFDTHTKPPLHVVTLLGLWLMSLTLFLF